MRTVWSDQPEPFVSPVTQGQLYLSFMNAEQVTEDYRRPSAGGTPILGELYLYTISVYCKAYGEPHALERLVALRTAIRGETASADLLALGMSLDESAPVNALRPDPSEDNRAVTAAQMDVTWNVVVNTLDKTARGDWIESVIPLEADPPIVA